MFPPAFVVAGGSCELADPSEAGLSGRESSFTVFVFWPLWWSDSLLISDSSAAMSGSEGSEDEQPRGRKRRRTSPTPSDGEANLGPPGLGEVSFLLLLLASGP